MSKLFEKVTDAAEKRKYSYMSVVWALSVLRYCIAITCKPMLVLPGVLIILNPCWVVELVILLLSLENVQLVLGGTNAALNLSVNEFPWSAVAIGWKFVFSIVPIAFTKSAPIEKSYTST